MHHELKFKGVIGWLVSSKAVLKYVKATLEETEADYLD